MWLCKPDVSSGESDPVLCIFANQLTFPDSMLALKIHTPPFLFAGTQSVMKAIESHTEILDDPETKLL